MGKESLLQRFEKARLKQEEKMEKLAEERLERDYEEGYLPRDLYKEITSIGVECARCGYRVTPKEYGEFIVTHSSEKTFKIICRFCEDIEW